MMGRPPNKQLTLLMLVEGSPDGAAPRRILLGMKKRGFGKGKWNGFGGKIDPGESIAEAALREMREESGLDVLDASYVGRNIFEFVGEPLLLEVHIFRASTYAGKLLETEEMQPAWFDVADVPYDAMWLDDREWLPLLLEGKRFENYFLFRGHDEILERDIRILADGEAFTRDPGDRLVDKVQESIALDLGIPS
ncbi:NUDIX hydrolase domain-like protein [Hyaloraphidium curvatum]|nr:NUDIX hydrolase domain-like protein [Hyaloraphidium curvatum]